jgi:hypothetical protein
MNQESRGRKNKKMGEKLTEFAEATIAEILDPALTPQGRAAAAVRKFKDGGVDSTKEALAVQALQIFKPAALDCIRTGDEVELARQIRQLLAQLPELRRPVPVKTPIEKALPVMLANGWTGAETDIVRQVSVGKEIGRVTWQGIEIGGEWKSRQAIRLSARAKWSQTDDAEWVRRFGPIREVKVDSAGQKYLGNDVLP